MIDIRLSKEWTLQKILWSQYFIVKESYIFSIFEEHDIVWNVEIPEWFITNLGSIPPILFMFDKIWYVSYIFHDYLYSLVWFVNINWKIRSMTRCESDNLLKKWLKNEGMSVLWYNVVYVWLKLFWGLFFKRLDDDISSLKYNKMKIWEKK